MKDKRLMMLVLGGAWWLLEFERDGMGLVAMLDSEDYIEIEEIYLADNQDC